MTISELGSLGEVIGAFGLIVTLVFLAMEMRLTRQAEESLDLEQVQIRIQEFNLAVATSPSLSAIMAKWNKLIDGHYQPLPDDITESSIIELFTEDERAALVNYFYGNAMNMEMILAKVARGTLSRETLRYYDTELRESARYLTVLGNMTIPPRLGRKYLSNSVKPNRLTA
ncbi:MAG: hypothetical protein CMP84_00015 [Gammaproteobacteria bacterium]|nr:hypothetical protein [Gammaproteobacteria bacterium]